MGIVNGDGYAVANIDDLGEGPGFRKVRRALHVTAFGVNAIVLPTGFETGRHWHDEQEEVYFLHRGRIEMDFGDGSTHVLEEGGVARVSPATLRRLRNVHDGESVYICFGGKDGYVGRDAHMPEGDSRVGPAPAT